VVGVRRVAFRPGMRMQQSLGELEEQLARQTREERERRERMIRDAERRALARERQRVHKRGSLRFAALVLVLLGTAVLVTIVMFQALYWVMG
jgi:cell division septal protein FtsQ